MVKKEYPPVSSTGTPSGEKQNNSQTRIEGNGARLAAQEDGGRKAQDNASGGLEDTYGLSPEFMERWRSYKTAKEKDTKDIIDALKAGDTYKPKTKEETEKEEKKRKRDGLFAAIGEGIQALSNLYFTSRGALNSYDPKNSLTKALRERWDRIDKKDKENKDSHENTLMKINELQNAADNEEMGWRKYFETARQKRAAQKAAKEAADKKAAAEKEERDRNYNLKKKKQEDDAERARRKDEATASYQAGQQALGRERNAISRRKEDRLSSGGSGSSSKQGKAYTPEHTRAAWNEWWRYTDEQRDEWRERFGNREDAKDDDYFVNAVKQMHDDYLREKAGSGAKSGGSPAKGKPSPTGGKKAGGKKSPTA